MAATGLSEIVTLREKDLRLYLYFLLSLVRDLWMLHERGQRAAFINSDLRELLEANSRDLAWIRRATESIHETLKNLRYEINRWLAFEHLAHSMMGPP